MYCHADHYLRVYWSKDPTWLQVVEFVFAGVLSDSMWKQFTDEWGGGPSDQVTGAAALLPGMNSFVACIVQIVYARRIWVLTDQSMKGSTVALIVVMLALVQAIINIKASAEVPNELTDDTRYCGFAWVCVSAISTIACDLLFTTALAILLRKARSSTRLQQTATLLNRLVFSTVETGAMTSVSATLQGSVLFFPATPFYTVFLYTLGRLYATSLLASLNRRNPELVTKGEISVVVRTPDQGPQSQSKESKQFHPEGLNTPISPSSTLKAETPV
ncbi:hypothetical protein AX16_003940 [Volvariella volvacea WC 439]|nr:hypothetical protein AX16_003940 [Volvariella volvacea WC 439]